MSVTTNPLKMTSETPITYSPLLLDTLAAHGDIKIDISDDSAFFSDLSASFSGAKFLHLAKDFTDTVESRYTLTHVCFLPCPAPHKGILMIATDGLLLGVYHDVEGMASKPFVLRYDKKRNMPGKAADGETWHINQDGGLTIGDMRLDVKHFAMPASSGNGTTSKAIRYPDITRALPRTIRASSGTNYFTDNLKTFSAISAPKGSLTPRIHMVPTGAKSPTIVETSTGLLGLIMSVRENVDWQPLSFEVGESVGNASIAKAIPAVRWAMDILDYKCTYKDMTVQFPSMNGHDAKAVYRGAVVEIARKKLAELASSGDFPESAKPHMRALILDAADILEGTITCFDGEVDEGPTILARLTGAAAV